MAKAPASSLEPTSRDWVPLFITLSTARGSNSLTDSDAPTHTAGGSESESDADSDSDTETQPQSSSHPEIISKPVLATTASHSNVNRQKGQQRQGSRGVHVGAKAWRGQLKEWLGFVGGIKGARGVFRSEELKQCVMRQLQDTDSGVQQAALRSLQVSTASSFTPSSTSCRKAAWPI